MAASMAAFAVGAMARADSDDVWIISASTRGEYDLQFGTPETSTYSVSLGIGHSLLSSFEVLIAASYQSVVNPGLSPNSSNEFDLLFNWVLDGGHADALYLGAFAGRQGFDRYGAVSSDLDFGGTLGKRFALGGIVSYEPSVSVRFVDASGSISSPAIQFVPLQLSLVF